MENKKTLVAIIITTIVIIALIVISYFHTQFSTNQVKIFTTEVNKILESNLVEDNIDFDIKTEKNYAKVEKAIKEYISKMKNIYVEMQEMISNINPNIIFSAQNVENKDFLKIDQITEDLKEKSRNLISEFEELEREENIINNINEANITTRSEFYTELYNEVMLSDVMKNQYKDLEEQIKNEKATLYEKINKINKIKVFLEENKKSWTIKNDKIQFTNLNRMTEYYALINQLID